MFTHLHTHTDASKDGLREVGQLIKAAKDIGLDALAMTDHGSMANAVSFSLAARSVGIKPIIGIEAYVEFDGKTGHMTLLGHGQRGMENIIALNNIGHASTTKAPQFSLDRLLEYSSGLVCLSGCVASPFHQLPIREATNLALKFKHIFDDRFFMEMMFVADTDTWSRPIHIAEKLGIPLVVTNDVHFPFQDDASIHKLVTRMRSGFDYNSDELWLKPPEEIWKRAKRFITRKLFDEATSNVAMIAGRIKAVDFNYKPTLPHIDDADLKLMKLVAEGRLVPVTTVYDERVAYELDIIKRMDYSAYFVILHDIVSEARRLGAYVGPGRGSGAGSLILYILGITDIDPIEHELPFERFLNPERHGMPDVDVDIDSKHRDLVIDYVAKRWSGIPIGTVIRYSHKTATHDLAKALRIPRDLENEVAERGLHSPAGKQLVEEFPQFEQAYEAIQGQIRHRGRHAAGIVITERTVPIERASGNLVAAWAEGKYNEMSKAGVVKYDLLGLEALTILQTLERMMPHKVAESKLHEDNDPAFQLFRNGDLGGIFQFSGSFGIRALTMKLAPTKFGDLVALNALYRPGTLDAGTADKFVEWRHEPRKVPHIIEDILAPTYGAIVYQEQVMELYARLTGGTLAEADVARRVVVKSKTSDPEWVREFEATRSTFLSEAVKRGLSASVAEKIWDEIATHSRYSFNKAHATAYAQIAWQMAWWKWNYPAEFFAAIMSEDRDNLQQYIFEVIARGFEVKLPTINEIGENDNFVVDGKTIIIPANVIKYVTSTEPILKELEKGKFKSTEDFMKRVPKGLVRGQARGALAAIGAFDKVKGSILALDLSPKMVETINRIRKSSNPERAAQIEFLGFFIPNEEDVKAIERATAAGQVCGIVSSIKDKKSGYGPYKVFYLNPSGLFWTRGIDVSRINVGDIVRAKVNKSTGKATRLSVI